MAVMNAQYKHPNSSVYSQGLRDLIDYMLKVNPSERPDIEQVRSYGYISSPWSDLSLKVIERTDQVLRTLA